MIENTQSEEEKALAYFNRFQEGFIQYGKPSAKSDVFAFGATMYHLWTGLSPRSFSERNLPNVPALRELVFDCVEEDPALRPKSSKVLISRLEGLHINRQVEEESLRKEKEERERAERKAEKELLRQKQQAIEAKRQSEKERLRKEKQARERSERQAEEKIKLNKQLLALNPFDHLRLLWWILVMPQQLKAYRTKFGEEDEKRIGKWLVSTLTFLPLLMPTLALGLEILPHNSSERLIENYHWISLLLVGAWLITGWLGGINDEVSGILASIMVVCMAWGIIAVSSNMVDSVLFGVTGIMAVGIASGAVSIIVVGVVLLVAGTMVVVGVAWVKVVDVVLTIGGFALGVGGVGSMVATGRGDVIKESLKTGTPSWFARFAFLLLVTAHLFLIYYCLLGGWQLFV